MATDLLDMHLKLLVLEHGRARVVQSLAHVNGVSEASIESQLATAERAKAVKSARIPPTPDELLARMDMPTAKRDCLATLTREFVNKRFLGELRLVGKFLREHGVNTVPKTRAQALPKVLSILATMPETELNELISDTTNEQGSSGFAHLAGAIMGKQMRGEPETAVYEGDATRGSGRAKP